jgi:hypothetical protein
MKNLFAICLAFVAGCASTTQNMTSPPESRITLEFRGEGGHGPVIIVNNAQVGVTAKPVGLDILNPAVAANAAYQQGANQTQTMDRPQAVAIKPAESPQDSDESVLAVGMGEGEEARQEPSQEPRDVFERLEREAQDAATVLDALDQTRQAASTTNP